VELVTFTKKLNKEEQRHLREQISEEALAVKAHDSSGGAGGDREDVGFWITGEIHHRVL
jgi:hypothetical protein